MQHLLVHRQPLSPMNLGAEPAGVRGNRSRCPAWVSELINWGDKRLWHGAECTMPGWLFWFTGSGVWHLLVGALVNRLPGRMVVTKLCLLMFQLVCTSMYMVPSSMQWSLSSLPVWEPFWATKSTFKLPHCYQCSQLAGCFATHLKVLSVLTAGNHPSRHHAGPVDEPRSGLLPADQVNPCNASWADFRPWEQPALSGMWQSTQQIENWAQAFRCMSSDRMLLERTWWA